MPRHGDGFSNGKQAYSCGECRRRYVPEGAYRRPGPAVKAQGIAMSTEGNSLSAMGRMLGYGAAAVQGWVEIGWKKGAPGPERSAGLEQGAHCGSGGTATGGGGVVSCDEMWTYRGIRRGERGENCRIWTAVIGEFDGRRWVDFEVGDRSEAPFLRL